MALRLGRGRFRLGCACGCGLVQKQQQRFMFSLPLSTCGNVTKLTVVPPPKYQQLVLTPRRCLSAGLNAVGGNQIPSCDRRNFLQLYLCQAHKPKLPVLTPLSTAPRSNSWCSSSSPLVSPRTNLSLQNPGHCIPFRPFRTTPRAYVHPILWLIVQPIAKITAIISGRSFRKWWKALPEHRKVYSRENLKKNWYWFAAGGATLGGLMYAYYRSHLQETPITHRVRFLPVSDKQAEKIAQEEANLILQKHAERCLPTSHPYYRLVVEITRRLVSSNQDLQKIKDHTWTVTVIEDDERNAFVLPTGHIFVFTGLIQTTENMDQLAAVLGHEMAHTLLSHGADQLSFMQLVDWMIIAVMAAIWAIMPNDGIAVVTQWFYHKVINFLLHLPYSRKLEKEADKVGLHLCAKACFDVRESSAFWMLMDCLARLEEGKVPEWLSTHPSNEKRVEHLNFIMAKAMDERKACSCPALPATDPRDRVQPKVKMTDSVVRAMQAGVNLQQVHVIQRRAPQSA